MMEDERNQTGKYSDEYKDELAGCYGIMFVVLIACGVVCGVAYLVSIIKGA